jgi:hypothetical protein
LSGLLRRVLHWTEHPALSVDAAEATRINERTNLVLSSLVRPDGSSDPGCSLGRIPGRG